MYSYTDTMTNWLFDRSINWLNDFSTDYSSMCASENRVAFTFSTDKFVAFSNTLLPFVTFTSFQIWCILYPSTMADSLLRLCMHVIEYRRDIFHWLFAMPLLHFLSESVQPYSFETLTLEPSSVKDTSWWGTQGLDFQSVRRQAAFSRYPCYRPDFMKYLSYISEMALWVLLILKKMYIDILLCRDFRWIFVG